jgi:hypothetical protein
VKIERNSAVEREILDHVKASFDVPREGIHLSDTLSPRQAFWRRVMPMPPSDQDVLFWVAGRSAEDMFTRVPPLLVADEAAYEVSPTLHVLFRPDFHWLEIDRFPPTEFKSRRAPLAKPGEEPKVYKHYLEQLSGYMAMEGLLTGKLVVFDLGRAQAGQSPQLAVYDVTISVDETLSRLTEIGTTATALQAAIIGYSIEAMAKGFAVPLKEVIDSLPLCEPWLCGGRKKVFAEPDKRADGMTPLTLKEEWRYVVRCPYYPLCRPQDTDKDRQ